MSKKNDDSRKRGKGNFLVIIVLALVIVIAVGYMNLRDKDASERAGLLSCGGSAVSDADVSGSDISSSDVSGGDVAKQADGEISKQEADKSADESVESVDREIPSNGDISSSDAVSDSDAGGDGFFASMGNWFGNLFSKIGGWFTEMFSSCSGQDAPVSSGGDAPDRVTVSESDLQAWDVQGDDAQYMSMMSEKMNEYIGYLSLLGELEETLSECRNADQIRKNGEFAALEQELNNWCGAALLYPKEAVFSEKAQQAWQLTYDLSKDTIEYLSVYPEIVMGEYDTSEAEELKNSVGDKAVQLYALLHGLSQPISDSDAA